MTYKQAATAALKNENLTWRAPYAELIDCLSYFASEEYGWDLDRCDDWADMMAERYAE